jgi:hypothetical protein
MRGGFRRTFPRPDLRRIGGTLCRVPGNRPFPRGRDRPSRGNTLGHTPTPHRILHDQDRGFPTGFVEGFRTEAQFPTMEIHAELWPQTVLELSEPVAPFCSSLIRPVKYQRSHHLEQNVRRCCPGCRPASADASPGPNPARAWRLHGAPLRERQVQLPTALLLKARADRESPNATSRCAHAEDRHDRARLRLRRGLASSRRSRRARRSFC